MVNNTPAATAIKNIGTTRKVNPNVSVIDPDVTRKVA
jgi:hypothetical protein